MNTSNLIKRLCTVYNPFFIMAAKYVASNDSIPYPPEKIARLDETPAEKYTVGSESLIPREWLTEDSNNKESTPKASTTSKSKGFKVFQWNILADTLACNGDFFRCPSNCLQWMYRKPLILQEILRSRADIICLEEVDHFEDCLKPELSSNGFKGIFFPKPDSPCTYYQPNNGPDGCALLYRGSMFTLLEKKDVVLKRENGEDSHQVAILVRLALKEQNEEKVEVQDKNNALSQHASEVCVAVTHFKAKSEGKELRLSQGKHLLSEMSTFASGSPAVICGDFNAPKEEPVYQYIANAEKNIGVKFASSYKQVYAGSEPPLTSWKFRPGKESKYTIDYTWYTSDKLAVDMVWRIPTEEEIGEGGLPCPKYPSDHVALCTFFQLKE